MFDPIALLVVGTVAAVICLVTACREAPEDPFYI